MLVLRTQWLLALVLVACQPKQPLQPSFYTQKKDTHAPASCKDTLACYETCTPLTEECMLLCDQKSEAHAVDRARKVSYCSAEHGCAGDRSCTDERCAPQVQACVSPLVAPAPSPMAPQPYPGQVGGPTPMRPQPYPGQVGGATPMRPQPYPGQVGGPAPTQPQPYPGQASGPAPTQPQPYPGQQPAGYPPPPPGPPPSPPPGYRPPPPGYPPR